MVVFDFDGVFTDNLVIVDGNGIESVRCWRSDGLGISLLRSIGIKTMIVSTETNPVVSMRASKLKIECYQAVEDKGLMLSKIATDHELELDEIAFMGNDINDIPALKIVGLPAAVADACEELNGIVLYKTNRPGGFGAVREFCDLIYSKRKDYAK
jgi:YrbI family 3-deoxy-D-manno-octulosonate 8-phosphate phosphatase